MESRGVFVASATQSGRARRDADADLVDGAVVDRPALRVGGGSPPRDARGGVIIPAHDEAGVIGRTLTALAPLADTDVDVIVVCNGCSDETADIARSFAGVTVIETAVGSKTHAMNLGDAAATTWPRLYLDADIDISPAAVCDVFAALAEPGALAARASYVYDVVGATWPVRSYYRARSRIPGPERRLWGAGGYAAGEVGHARFERFPAVTADDSWFDEQFDVEEKRVVATEPMRVRTPRNASALIAVLSRQRRGYVEIGIASSARTRGRELARSVRAPRDAADLGWYVFFTLVSRRRAAAALRAGGKRWERDSSSRAVIRATP